MSDVPRGVAIDASLPAGAERILTEEALAFVADLQRRFGARRLELLQHRRVRRWALAAGKPDSLYVLDEPTTGLHPAEIAVLLNCLDELLEAGGSAVVVEHNLDLIAQSDYVIDLGPEGGPAGGRVVASGTPRQIARVRRSHTGAALRDLADLT